MNLVCFPGYTCGALFCDILNKESSQVGKNNNILSAKHNYGKVPLNDPYKGKDFDLELFNNQVKKYFDFPGSKNSWIGTHCWPGDLDTSAFENVIHISTENDPSKMYRYARIFFTMIAGKYPGVNKPKTFREFKPKKPEDLIPFRLGYDKVYRPNIINIEFEDVVNWKDDVTSVLLNFIGNDYHHHILNRRKVWTTVNDFLYDERINYIHKEWEHYE
jgi:hypothetical protein